MADLVLGINLLAALIRLLVTNLGVNNGVLGGLRDQEGEREDAGFRWWSDGVLVDAIDILIGLGGLRGLVGRAAGEPILDCVQDCPPCYGQHYNYTISRYNLYFPKQV